MPKSKKRPQKGRTKRRSLSAKPSVKATAAKPTVAPFKPDLETNDVAVLKEQVRKLMSGRHFSAAADCFRRMTELDPENAQFYNDLATAEAMNQMLPAARAAQAKAIELAPEVVKYKINMSKIMMMQKDYYSANELIEKVMPLAEGRRADELATLHEVCSNAMVQLFGQAPGSTAGFAPAHPVQHDTTPSNETPHEFWAVQEPKPKVNETQNEIIKGLDSIFGSASTDNSAL